VFVYRQVVVCPYQADLEYQRSVVDVMLPSSNKNALRRCTQVLQDVRPASAVSSGGSSEKATHNMLP